MLCCRYIDPDWVAPMFRMTTDQRRTRWLADQRQADNTIALLEFVPSRLPRRPRPLPIPQERVQPTIGAELLARREAKRKREGR